MVITHLVHTSSEDLLVLEEFWDILLIHCLVYVSALESQWPIIPLRNRKWWRRCVGFIGRELVGFFDGFSSLHHQGWSLNTS